MAIWFDFCHADSYYFFSGRFVMGIDTKKIFENIFAGYDDSKMVCTLRFISSENMKKHEPKIDYTTRDICIELIDCFFKTMTDECDKRCECSYAVFGCLKSLRGALKVDKNVQNEESAREVKGCIKNLEEAISRVKKCENNHCENKKVLCRELDKITEELDTLQFPMILFGCYYRTYRGVKDVIFICPENIWREGRGKNFLHHIDLEGLLCSVFVHEYAHFVDANTELHKSPRNKKERVLYSGLQETIAETIQKLYIDKYIDPRLQTQALQDWINDHSASGNFPGWGYAGAKILDKEGKHSLEDLLIKVIDISRKDWKAGYYFINSIKILEKM